MDGGTDPRAGPGAAGGPAAPPAGFFLTLEGVEGCGKTTQTDLLREHFVPLGVPTVLTREPGGTSLGDKIRELLLDPASDGMADRAELLLYEAARAHHVEQVIRPALEAGALVVCDRFMDSSTAYQGHGPGLSLDCLAYLNAFATDGVAPDLTIVLDVPPELGLQRACSATSPDRIEQRDPEFHARVREGFLQLARGEPERFVVLNGEGRPEAICRDLIDLVTARWSRLRASRTTG